MLLEGKDVCLDCLESTHTIVEEGNVQVHHAFKEDGNGGECLPYIKVLVHKDNRLYMV